MRRACELILLSILVLMGCDHAARLYAAEKGPPVTQQDENFIGYASMRADGTLEMHIYESRTSHETMDFELKPSDNNYEFSIEQAGGIRPNETKGLRRLLAMVYMDEDKSLTVSYFDFPDKLPVTILPGGPPPTKIYPGDKKYDELIRRAGGLQPGQSKRIFAGM